MKKLTGRGSARPKPKGGFPKVMIMMIPVQLIQAFSQNVMLSIKAIFITTVLGYGEDTAVMISHIFISFEPISHLTGAILADSTFGKWKVIVAGLIIMRIPDIFFVLSVLPGMPARAMFLTAVTLATFLNIYLPTLSAFFSEQFRMPEQEKLLKRYYNILYWGRNAVSVVGAFSGSRMASMSCFGKQDCYFAPFVLWVATEIFVAAVIISLGTLFVRKPPTSSVILHFLECVGRAIFNKIKYGKDDPRDRWIDHADDVFTDRFRDDVFTLIKLSYFFLLGILYWSLYDQMYSRFIYQGAKLDGRISENVRVYPGDTTILNPVLVILLLPFLEYVVYPLCSKINILTTDLQKVGTSEYLVATAFVAAALLEWQINKNDIRPPPTGTGHLILFNAFDRGLHLSLDGMDPIEVLPYKTHIYKELKVDGMKTFNLRVEGENVHRTHSVTIEEKKGISYILSEKYLDRIPGYENYKNRKKSKNPQIRCICTVEDCFNVTAVTTKGKIAAQLTCQPIRNVTSYTGIKEGYFRANMNGEPVIEKFRIEEHMEYTLILLNSTNGIEARLFESNPHYLIPYFWIVPQIFIMTLGEIMHAIPWRLFIYTQSPPPMRSVVFALELVSRSMGDLLVAIVAATSLLEQVYEFVLYASFMYLVSILFTLLAIKYKPHTSRE